MLAPLSARPPDRSCPGLPEGVARQRRRRARWASTHSTEVLLCALAQSRLYVLATGVVSRSHLSAMRVSESKTERPSRASCPSHQNIRRLISNRCMAASRWTAARRSARRAHPTGGLQISVLTKIMHFRSCQGFLSRGRSPFMQVVCCVWSTSATTCGSTGFPHKPRERDKR